MSYRPDLAITNYKPAGAPAMQGHYVGEYTDVYGKGVVRAINTLTAVGDSITNNSGAIDPLNPTATQLMYSKAYAEVANCLSGHKCQWVTPGTTGPGSVAAGSTGSAFALGGIYTDDVIYGGYMAAAVASAANTIVVHIGTNNVNRGDSASKIINDILQIWRMATSVGKRVIATTICPRDSSVITGAKLIVVNDVNRQIRLNAGTEPGVFLCDWYAALLDSSLNAPSSGAASQWTIDGLHPNPIGGWRMGSALAPILASLNVPDLPGDHLPINPGDVLTPNPFALGNTAGVATSWTITNVGAPTSVTPTKVTRPVGTDLVPGEFQQIVTVAATANTDGFTITLTDSTTSDWAVGDQLYACAEIQADSAGWDCRGLQLDVVMTGAAGVSSVNAIASADRTALTVPYNPAPVGGVVLVTPRIQVPASVTAVRAVLRWFGSGTIRVSRMGVRKI